MFPQEWKNAHRRVHSMPVGKIDLRSVREYTGSVDTQCDEKAFKRFDGLCERLQKRYDDTPLGRDGGTRSNNVISGWLH